MLSIGAMKGGQSRYYQSLASEDYYLHGGEPPGRWHGSGAKVLGLKGVVQSEELIAIFDGYSKSGSRLVQNAGKENRQPGWDLTFSAPKSVSVLWSQLDSPQQQEIQKAQAAAVAATLSFLESRCGYSRTGRQGAERIKASLVIATFEHSTSRALDPQLHTHCLVMNLGLDNREHTRSILSKPLYEAKMLAGAFYRCELARQLQARLGVAIERPLDKRGKTATWFEVMRVPKSLQEHFSKRRADIEEQLGRKGMDSASAAAFAALSTRKAKAIVPPRSELHATWKEEGLKLGFSPEAVLGVPRQVDGAEQAQLYRGALAEAVATITFSENYFTEDLLTLRTLEASQALGLDATLVVGAIKADLTNKSLFVPLVDRDGSRYFTTQEILDREKETLSSLEAIRTKKFSPVSERATAAAINKERGHGEAKFRLDAEQQAAVRYIAQGRESLKVVSGFAGTGKTDMLAAAKEALEKGGYRVIGTALANVAARTLEEKTGIESKSIRAREYQLYPDIESKLKHHFKQLFRAALGKTTYKLSPLKLDAKTVLVIDEAGMVGTRDFALLAKAVLKQGGSIVAVGDELQLSSIERGGVFGHLVKTIKGVRLTEIRRQKDAADRQAVKDVVEGRSEDALKHYAEKGQFFVGEDRSQAERELIADWAKNGGAQKPRDHHIFAGTRAEVAQFNTLAQWERAKAGVVDARQRVQHEDQVFMVGDEVRFHQAAKTRGIKKGETGTVIACEKGVLGTYVVVAFHRDASSFSARAFEATRHHAKQLLNAALGRRTEKLPPRNDVVVVPLHSLNPLTKSYQGLSLDYARTTHLGQGQTVGNSYVLLGGNMTDRELSYVQTSRHKDKLFLYTDEENAGKVLTDLARQTRPQGGYTKKPADDIPDYSVLATQMNLSRAKVLAVTMQQQRYPEL